MVALLLASAALAGCSSGASTAPPGGGLSGSVTVLAASSLTGAFETIAARFTAANPGVKVSFSFGASDVLAAQIVSGAPADVFASASPTTMATVTQAGDAGSARLFATNVLEIATPPTNPASIRSVADLARAGVKVALCQPLVPCGVTAEKMLAKSHIAVTPVTLGQDVKSVLTYVELSEVDAGVVYVTDVRAAGRQVHGVKIPPSENETTSYPIAVLHDSSDRRAAEAFVAYVESPAGQAVLKQAGFGAP
jgi:molybdate transport system substrate-binding protein